MSTIKHKDQRVGIFVDAQNMYHSARNLYKAKVNFKEILRIAVAGRQLIRAVIYVIKTESGEEQKFFGALAKQGFEVKEKDLQIFIGGMKKGDWDVGLAIDAVKMADKLDVVIIVSGDGDFVPLIEYLKVSKGCQVEVMAFGESASRKLLEAADDFINLSEQKNKFLIK